MQLSELKIKNATRDALRRKRTCLSRLTNAIANSKRERKAKRFCSFLFLVSSNLKEGESKKTKMTKSAKTHTPSTTSAQRRREHEEWSAKKKMSSVWQMMCTTKKRTRGSKRGNEHEARSAKKKKTTSIWQMTCTTKRQARGAKREKIFPHSDRWQAQRGRKHEARSAENFFFITRTDDEHNGGAGTRREAGQNFFSLLAQMWSTTEAWARGAKREARKFFFPLYCH